MRRAWYEKRPDARRRLGRPVISIGNLVVGGSGKTPLVATVVRMLCDRGERPSVLSRGYGRRHPVDGVLVVSDGRQVLASVERSGDEPQMLARTLPGVPVLVSPDRYLAGQLAERQFGCTVHVLDDGFQHVQLARDLDLLLVSRADLDEHVLPAGRLREPLSAARAADALIVTGTDEDAASVAGTIGHHTVFRAVASHGAVRPLDASRPLAAGRRVVAVAAIARPQRFFDALRAAGFDVTRELVFRDHHWFTQRDLASIEGAATDTKADLIVTTDKDAVRLETVRGAWAVLPIEVLIQPAARFSDWLVDRLRAARAA